MKANTEKILKSSAWLVAAVWVQRLFGIVSLFVLARLLGPEDFGVVALSSIVLTLFDAISVTGAQQYLLSRTTLNENDTDVAWTLNLLIKIGASLVIVLIAPLAASLFKEPRIELVLWVAATIPSIKAMSNPGLFLKQRNYEYGAIAITQVLTKIVSFAITLYIAFQFQSYWALIVGDVVNAILIATFSYLIHSHRPRLKLTGVKKQWGFSKWMLARSIVGFTRAKADQAIVGIFFETKLVGTYNISKEIVLMPFNQISEPLRPVFLSMFKDSKDEMENLRSSYTTKFIIMLAIMLPMAAGLYLLRADVVSLLLGNKWVGAEELIGSLVILLLTYSLTSSSSAILVVLDKLKMLFVLDVVTMLVIVSGQLAVRDFAIHEFAFMRSMLGVVTLLIYFLAIHKTINLNLRKLLVGSTPCVMATAIMSLSIILLGDLVSGSLFFALLVAFGMLIYTTVLVVLIAALKDHHSDLAFIYSNFIKYASKIKHRLLEYNNRKNKFE